MEYDILSFVSKLKDYFANSDLFPYMQGEYLSGYGVMQDSKAKHPNRNPPHLKDMTIQCIAQTTQFIDDNVVMFELGNEKMEKYYPYYHILQDAPVIRKKNKGTEKTRGSQAKIKDLGKRDYGIVEWNGKTFTKEYTRNVRGKRFPKNVMIYGGNFVINRNAPAYQNIHYHYIDKVIDEDVIGKLSSEFGLKPLRKQDSGLGEEYMSEIEPNEELQNDILNTFFSFD